MHDARAYARRVRAQATLTGACIIALGNDYGGMWSSDDGLAADLSDAAERTGELLWRSELQYVVGIIRYHAVIVNN